MLDKWKVLKRETYRHSPFRAIEDVTYELPNGEHSIFSLKKEGAVVAVMAIDSNEQVILARQYRPGPSEILDELPGGGIDGNETPLDAAKRELLEETGFMSEDWTLLGTPLECAYSTITRYAYLAKSCRKVTELDLDETEYIEVVYKSIDDFFSQVRKGDCSDPEVGWMALYEYGYLSKK
ncbi:ADP-ribose pyrophosphatase [Halobacteriovorax marinus]|uniref:GDP-mannose pyrophosphatase n=1 Tax=Halobacteriovorax marinus TaxID=97084 RepID=A0A1Y5F8R4_9BACT|nr:ADP-ribose pyrophosphatase [Halobacteriovorax marinus]